MRIWLCGALVALVGLSVVNAETNQTELNRALGLLQSMPECGRTCLLDAIGNSTCALTDIECSCNNHNITVVTQACVLASCSVRNQLTTKNTTQTLCHKPFRDRRGPGHAGVIAGLTLSWIAFVLRIYSKISVPCGSLGKWASKLWWDDAVMAFAMALITVISWSAEILNENGLGTDVWTVPFDKITRILKIYYWDEDLYLTALPAVKISLLLTYLRIFQSRNFRIACFIVIGLNIAYAITFVLISVFQCWPISMAWNRWDKEHEGRCNHINAQGWASAALNVLLDFLTLSLPLPSLWKMELNKRKKFWVMLMFSLGFFVTIVSILRLQVLIEFGDSQNLTWDYTAVGYWSTIELHASVVCACMPAIRNLLRRYIPRIMGQTTGQSGRVSGPTAVESGTGKGKNSKNIISIRTRDSDEEDFIPLDSVHGSNGGYSNGQFNATQALPPSPKR